MNNHIRDGRSHAEPTKAESLRLFQRADAMRPRRLASLAGSLIVLAVAAGCAKTAVTRQPVATGQLPRPAHIWVYDFVAREADLPAGSALAGQIAVDAASQTPEQLAMGRALGAQIAAELVAQIRGMGMPAARAVAITKPTA